MRSDRYYVCPSCHFGDYLSDLTTLPERLLGRQCPHCRRRTLKVCRDTANHEWRKVEGPYSTGGWSHKDEWLWRSSDGLEWHGPPDQIYYWTRCCRFILRTMQPYYQGHRAPPGLCPRHPADDNIGQQITLIGSKFKRGSLQMLTLDGDNLNGLSLAEFGGVYKWQILNLSHNNLSELPPGVFDGLDRLLSLDLSFNPGAPFRITHPNADLQGRGWRR